MQFFITLHDYLIIYQQRCDIIIVWMRKNIQVTVLYVRAEMIGLQISAVVRDAARCFTIGGFNQTLIGQYAQDALLNRGVTHTVTVTPTNPSDFSDIDVIAQISLPKPSVAIVELLGLHQSGAPTACVTILTE